MDGDVRKRRASLAIASQHVAATAHRHIEFERDMLAASPSRESYAARDCRKQIAMLTLKRSIYGERAREALFSLVGDGSLPD